MKMAEDDDRLILRLFEPTGEARTVTVAIPPLDLRFDITLGAFECKTLAVDLASRTVRETDLLERDVAQQDWRRASDRLSLQPQKARPGLGSP
jgi:alpha-mannosidase